MCPGWIDTLGSKAIIIIVTHVGNMNKGASLWTRYHRFVDLSSFGTFLLFLLGLGFCYMLCE